MAPKNDEVLREIGLVFDQRRQFDRALEMYQLAIAAAPEILGQLYTGRRGLSQPEILRRGRWRAGKSCQPRRKKPGSHQTTSRGQCHEPRPEQPRQRTILAQR